MTVVDHVHAMYILSIFTLRACARGKLVIGRVVVVVVIVVSRKIAISQGLGT